MTKVELYAKAFDAVQSLAGDLSVEPEVAAQNLDDLTEEIGRMKASDLDGHIGAKELASPTDLPPTMLTIDGVNYIVVCGHMPDDREAVERAVRQALINKVNRGPGGVIPLHPL